MALEHKTCRLELKEVTDEGTFQGVASVYGVEDLGADIVEKGAFTKTIREQKGKVVLLWQHHSEEPIGFGIVEDTKDGLAIHGELIMDMEQARDAHAFMKRSAKVGRPAGLSIGFQTIKDKVDDGIRYLKELKLWEVSVVTFPMQLGATVTTVKAAKPDNGTEQKRTFDESLEMIDLYAKRYQLINALCDSLDTIVWANNVDAGEKLTQIDASIEQFHIAYIDFIPKYLDMLKAEGFSDKTTLELKEARQWSDDARKRIASAITNLKALLPDEAAPSTPPVEAAPEVPVKPDLHLMAKAIAADIRQLA